jgi:hypothetical protein
VYLDGTVATNNFSLSLAAGFFNTQTASKYYNESVRVSFTSLPFISSIVPNLFSEEALGTIELAGLSFAVDMQFWVIAENFVKPIFVSFERVLCPLSVGLVAGFDVFVVTSSGRASNALRVQVIPPVIVENIIVSAGVTEQTFILSVNLSIAIATLNVYCLLHGHFLPAVNLTANSFDCLIPRTICGGRTAVNVSFSINTFESPQTTTQLL